MGAGNFGVRVTSSSSPVIRRCMIDNCENGANVSSASPTFDTCRFTGNKTAVKVVGGSPTFTDVRVDASNTGFNLGTASSLLVNV